MICYVKSCYCVILIRILRCKLNEMLLLKKNIKIFIVLFLAAYFYIGYTSIINRHTHFYPNGIVVTHSHPVNKSSKEGKPINDHDHSSTEICFFQCTSFDKVILPPVISAEYTPLELTNNYCPLIETPVLIPQINELPPRAPPV